MFKKVQKILRKHPLYLEEFFLIIQNEKKSFDTKDVYIRGNENEKEIDGGADFLPVTVCLWYNGFCIGKERTSLLCNSESDG